MADRYQTKTIRERTSESRGVEIALSRLSSFRQGQLADNGVARTKDERRAKQER